MEDESNDYLKPHYDVIVCGTGLVESIVSCAASRCGLEVLHVDRNDYYGGNYATFNLKDFMDIGGKSQDGQAESMGFHLGQMKVVPLRERGLLATPPAATGSSEEVSAETPSETNTDETEGNSSAAVTEQTPQPSQLDSLLQKYRRFSLDLNAKFLFAAGLSVDYFVKSGVANYLEFKSIDGITYVDKKEVFSVPCSKADMFNSRFFNPLEKRVLTKFLMFVTDYGRAAAGVDLVTLNEKQLAQGRSLHRPQNKEVTVSEYDVESYLDKPFREFLTHCKISPRLQTIIVHALCFYVRNDGVQTNCDQLDTKSGLHLLSTHLTATGRYGDTALLWPIYGASEIPQAFCRMSAVWGAVYLLRTCVNKVVKLDVAAQPWNNNTLRRNVEENDESECNEEPDSSKAIGSVTEEVANSNNLLQVTLSTGRSITCNAFVSNCEEYCTIDFGSLPRCLDVRAALISCSVVCLLDESGVLPLSNTRGIEIIPPLHLNVGNQHAIYIIQSDSSCQVCIDGTAILHIETQVDTPSDRRIVIGDGCADATKWEEFVNEQQQSWANIIDNALDTLEALHHIKFGIQKAFARPLYADVVAGSIIPNDQNALENLAVVGESYRNFHLSTDDTIAQASAVFSRILPGRVFMHQAELDPNFRSGSSFSNPLESVDDEMEYLVRTLDTSLASKQGNESSSSTEAVIVGCESCTVVPSPGSSSDTAQEPSEDVASEN